MYPSFAYNAVGGGGYAQVEDLGNGLLRLTFDPDVSLDILMCMGVPIKHVLVFDERERERERPMPCQIVSQLIQIAHPQYHRISSYQTYLSARRRSSSFHSLPHSKSPSNP